MCTILLSLLVYVKIIRTRILSASKPARIKIQTSQTIPASIAPPTRDAERRSSDMDRRVRQMGPNLKAVVEAIHNVMMKF